MQVDGQAPTTAPECFCCHAYNLAVFRVMGYVIVHGPKIIQKLAQKRKLSPLIGWVDGRRCEGGVTEG